MINNTRFSHKLLIRFALVTVIVIVVAWVIQSGFHVLPCIVTKHIEIQGVSLRACIADEQSEQTLGLSRSLYLPSRMGMLFEFSEPGNYGFWMREMRYPIDILWLDDHMRPVVVARNVNPDTYPSTFMPQNSVRYVLETRPSIVPGEYLSPEIVENPLAQ